MNKDEKRISYIIFKNKILESSEQSYENFFVEVMCKYNSNFQPVKPQGRIGDKRTMVLIKKREHIIKYMHLRI
jgi:hypothetical protein